MSAARLREAAGYLRELAGAATPGPWRVDAKDHRADVRGLPENTSYDYRGDAVATAGHGEFGACPVADAAFVAVFDPVVAGLLADWLDAQEDVWSGLSTRFEAKTYKAALAVADAILEGRS